MAFTFSLLLLWLTDVLSTPQHTPLPLALSSPLSLSPSPFSLLLCGIFVRKTKGFRRGWKTKNLLVIQSILSIYQICMKGLRIIVLSVTLLFFTVGLAWQHWDQISGWKEKEKPVFEQKDVLSRQPPPPPPPPQFPFKKQTETTALSEFNFFKTPPLFPLKNIFSQYFLEGGRGAWWVLVLWEWVKLQTQNQRMNS